MLDELGDDIRLAEKDLRQAISSAPIHGRLIALRYLVARTDLSCESTSWGKSGGKRLFYQKLIKYCFRVWDTVKEILCVRSPEGQVSIDADADDSDIGAKDTRSFSWRALKEARLDNLWNTRNSMLN
jgi:hypothetical protein